MKIIRIIMASLIIFSTVFTLTFGYKKIGEEKLKDPKEFKGIITIWQIDGFEGGSGSRKQFLLSVSRDFEKQNEGTLVMVINHTFTSAEENISKGIYPDIISYSNGLDIKKMSPINTSRCVGGGKVGEKVYATAWCRGGYVLIKNLDLEGKDETPLIVSKGQNTQPILAMMLEGLEFENIEVLSPMDAYTKFTLGKNAFMLGTQRDVVRLTNRGGNFSAIPLTNFNDLYQYVSLTASDTNKSIIAKRFIDYLLSDKVQERLNKINMLSPYKNVSFDIENLNLMQNSRGFSTISAFNTKEVLSEMHSMSMLAIKGDKNAIKYVKNLLI
ncbi:MAG: hypothetical protein E7372_04290 [Clostridiales bacterium]|nr:hypothetical protein [Clostridiales bacterium]